MHLAAVSAAPIGPEPGGTAGGGPLAWGASASLMRLGRLRLLWLGDRPAKVGLLLRQGIVSGLQSLGLLIGERQIAAT